MLKTYKILYGIGIIFFAILGMIFIFNSGDWTIALNFMALCGIIGIVCLTCGKVLKYVESKKVTPP